MILVSGLEPRILQKQLPSYGTFIYLSIMQEPNPTTAVSVRANAKEREVRRAKKKKAIEAERMKPPIRAL